MKHQDIEELLAEAQRAIANSDLPLRAAAADALCGWIGNTYKFATPVSPELAAEVALVGHVITLKCNLPHLLDAGVIPAELRPAEVLQAYRRWDTVFAAECQGFGIGESDPTGQLEPHELLDPEGRDGQDEELAKYAMHWSVLALAVEDLARRTWPVLARYHEALGIEPPTDATFL